MRTYWDEFIKRYKDKIPYTSLSIMLEAYFHYIENKIDIADDLMHNQKHQEDEKD